MCRTGAAALATTVTVASLLQIELVTVPATSSAGGFVYRLRPDLGVFERATNEFGPFFTERALPRSGRGTGVDWRDISTIAL